ncbi:MAG: 3-oxoacyl-[acyl-carrier-protein] synthase-3 [Granulosicoccus sp.]|jgi:3-oxoacyl-[acyl-carrier-protein] synthase-3
MPDLISCNGVSLAGIAACVPKEIEDNTLLLNIEKRTKQEIVDKVGIRYRRKARAEVCASDLCEKAAERLMQDLDWESHEIQLLIFVTQTPDHLIPGTAPTLVFRLGLNESCFAFDVNQGCSGYVNGLSIATGLMQNFGLKKGLLLVGDTITRTFSQSDMSLVPIFSDAGSATALELNDSDNAMSFLHGTVGKDYKAIHIPDGGGRNKLTAESMQLKQVSDHIKRSSADLAMNGQDVFAFGLSTVPKGIKRLLELTKTPADFIDALVLHQANQFLSDLIAKKVGVGKEKVPSSLYNFGNTSCATIPVTLVAELRNQLKNEDMKLILAGFGVGLAWSNVLLSTYKIVCPEIIEI